MVSGKKIIPAREYIDEALSRAFIADAFKVGWFSEDRRSRTFNINPDEAPDPTELQAEAKRVIEQIPSLSSTELIARAMKSLLDEEFIAATRQISATKPPPSSVCKTYPGIDRSQHYEKSLGFPRPE